MDRFPADAPRARVIKALARLGFALIREREHIAMRRLNPDGSFTPLTLPNHRTIKGSTPRTIRSQSGISRDEFLRAFESR